MTLTGSHGRYGNMMTFSDYDVYLFALVYKCHCGQQIGWNRIPYSMPVLRV